MRIPPIDNRDARSDPGSSSGEFSLYDHVLDHSAAFNVIPKRYQNLGLSPLDVYFAMGRGRQADGVDVPASEMKKWYETWQSFN